MKKRPEVGDDDCCCCCDGNDDDDDKGGMTIVGRKRADDVKEEARGKGLALGCG